MSCIFYLTSADMISYKFVKQVDINVTFQWTAAHCAITCAQQNGCLGFELAVNGSNHCYPQTAGAFSCGASRPCFKMCWRDDDGLNRCNGLDVTTVAQTDPQRTIPSTAAETQGETTTSLTTSPQQTQGETTTSLTTSPQQSQVLGFRWIP